MEPSDRKRNGCKECRKGCERVLHPEGTCVEAVSSGVCFPFVGPGVLTGGGGETHMWSSRVAHGYEDFVDDIYSCDCR